MWADRREEFESIAAAMCRPRRQADRRGEQVACRGRSADGVDAEEYDLRPGHSFSGDGALYSGHGEDAHAKAGEEMWVEVTVPPKGPPRAIQIAVSGNGKFEPIRFE